MKTCAKCKVEKDEGEFGKLKQNRDGINNTCKQCNRDYFNNYSKENRDICNKIRAKYMDNLEVRKRVNELRNLSYNKNPQKYRRKSKDWREKNIDKAIETERNYRSKNKEKCNELTRIWFANNKNYSHNWRKSDKGIFLNAKRCLKKQIGETPPHELVEIKVLINKTKALCKTLKS